MKRYVFTPREDITTLELAQVLEILLQAAAGRRDLESLFDASPSEVRRHFSVLQTPPPAPSKFRRWFRRMFPAR